MFLIDLLIYKLMNMKILRRFGGFSYRLVCPIVDPINFLLVIPRYFSFCVDFIKYLGIEGSQKLNFLDLHPVINDKTEKTQFDPQYFYQGVWAFDKIYKSKVLEHVDVGSQTNLTSFLSVIMHVKFVDIRPLEADLNNFESIKGSILKLPFYNNSIKSLSCLHVAEHIGLGRYGDPMDVKGTKKACKELARVLAPDGNLYFSLPIGVPRICFNAHRVHSVQQITNYFPGLELKEFSAVDDKGKLFRNADPKMFEEAIYSGGLFHFTKNK